MFKVLRIICCIMAVLLSAACIFVFVYADSIGWGFLCVVVAVIFYFLMIYFKGRQEQKDGTQDVTEPEGDFITGRVTAENASERTARMNSAVTVENADGEPRTFIIVKGREDTFDKVGIQSALGKVTWGKKIGDEITYKDGDLKDVTLKITNIE